MPSPPNAMTTFTEPMMVHAADLNPFTQNINDIYANQLVSGFFSRYTMSNNVTSGPAWTVASPSLVEGTGLGLSLAGSLFTLGAGIWEVNWSMQLASGAVNLILELSTDTTATASNALISAGFVGISNVTSGAVGMNIRSTGTALVSAKCFIFTATGAGAPAFSRLTFMKESTS